MVSSITDPLPVDSIVEDPPNSIVAIFGFDGSTYFPATNLEPGKGYWMRAAQECRVTFLSSILRSSAVSRTFVSVSQFRSDELPPGAPVESPDKIVMTLHHPTEYVLKANYPNPFNPATTITFDLPEESQVSLRVYNVLGQEVSSIVTSILGAGSYSYQWNPAVGLPSGIYLYQMIAGSTHSGKRFAEAKKMILSK